ncbi:MAG: SMC-Scp complex subunit ScpB [Chitinispirillia bacterium]|nr:SMC-Scp complex subunit ScpB [Chitinispirillia bacterium]
MEDLENTKSEDITAQQENNGNADDQEIDDQSEEKVDELRILEALLFASEELLTYAKLKALLPSAPDVKQMRKMVNEINEKLQSEDHPFEIAESGGGFQFRTLALYYPWVRKLYKERAAKKLSVAALECLAIIAYRQPISKAEVEVVRGVMSDGSMKTLLEKRLVDFTRDDSRPGRPLLYSTTNEFLKYFGINKISDLPKIEEFEAMARGKMEELSTEELSSQEELVFDQESDLDLQNQQDEGQDLKNRTDADNIQDDNNEQ